MASQDSGDIFLKFRDQFGLPVPGESQTVVGSSMLFAGFGPGLMFEIDKFSLEVGIKDENSEADKVGRGQGDLAKGLATAVNALGARIPGGPGNRFNNAVSDLRTNPGKDREEASFQAFRSGRSGVKYPVSVQPISITRPIDKSSPSLLQKCIDTESFQSATVVKRKAAGTVNAGEPYFRMDFVGVLITNVSWSNNEPITETLKFISRAITVRYRSQAADGSLYAPKVGFWSMLPWETEAPLC